MILKANGLKGKGRIKGFLGDIFGVSDQYYTAYDTAGYKKGAMSWSGEDHKALTEVIPTYLSKIYDSISGKGESRYDYEKGKFVSEKDIRDAWERKYTEDSLRAHGDFSREILRKIDEVYKDDKQKQDELKVMMSAIFKDESC